MRACVILILMFFVYILNLYATEIYVNTNPINSKVYINGQIIGNTPVRTKIKGEKKIDIDIKKDGYKTLQKIVVINGERVLNFHFDLAPDKIQLILNDKGKIVNICGMPVGETPAILYNVPNGMYEIKKNKKSYDINPAGYKYAIRSTAIESVYSGGMLTLFLLKMNDLKNKGDDVGTAVTSFGSVIMGAVLSYDLLKLLKLRIIKEKARVEVKKIKFKPYQMKDDRILFTEGVSLLGQKRYKNAIEKFSLLTKIYEDSQYVPISYYELGFCYYNLKNYYSTINILNDFLNKYPIYEVYQYAFYYYLNSLIKLKKYSWALIDYQSFKPLIIEDESGTLYKMYYSMLIELYKNNMNNYKRMPYDILKYLNYFLKKYSNSSAFPEIMVLKAELLYRYISKNRGLKVIEEIKRIYGKDQKIMKKLESIVGK